MATKKAAKKSAKKAPAKKAAKKSTAKKTTRKYGSAAGKQVKTEMHEMHEGKLKSGRSGKKGMSRAELAWMRARLLPLMQAGKIDVEEEFRQACFHISVYRTYLPPTHEVAVVHAASAAQRAQ